MPKTARQSLGGMFFHGLNRGNARDRVFADDADYAAFKKVLAETQAKAFVRQDKSHDVPNHLRNAPTGLMEKLGHGKDYRYAHNEPDGFAAGVQYLPNGMTDPHWYQPVERGLEIKIGAKLKELRNRDSFAKNAHDKK